MFFSSLANAITGPRRGMRFTQAEVVVTCGHHHLVCKDCGAVVETKAPVDSINHGNGQSQLRGATA
jgi:Fe2+ or Zn2+ uptake regulation protein